MTGYRGNAEAVRNLVRETEVHRDVYIDDEVFALEMEHLFANTPGSMSGMTARCRIRAIISAPRLGPNRS